MIPERGVGARPSSHSDESVSPRSIVQSVSANPESSRNAINRGLLPDLDSMSPSPRKRSATAAHVIGELEASSPSKRQNAGKSQGGQRRRPVLASVYANLEEMPVPADHSCEPEPGSGVQSTGVTPLMTRMLVSSERADEDNDFVQEFGGFLVASPFNSRRQGPAEGGAASKGKYLDAGGSDWAEVRGVQRGEARNGGAGRGRRPLRLSAVTWNLAGKLPPASIGSIAPGDDVDIFAMGTQVMVIYAPLSDVVASSHACP